MDAWYTRESHWHIEGCSGATCTQSEKYEEGGAQLLVEDYAIVAPGFEDRGYESGQYWMALIHEFLFTNQYDISEADAWTTAGYHAMDWCWDTNSISRPYIFSYPYRWSIAFDDGTRWTIHDPGNDLDAVWTDTFKIYDFHGKPVYVGGVFISQDFGSAPSKRIYFMYYEGNFYLEEEIYPDHNCAWFGCYEHDVYGSADGLKLALWDRTSESAEAYLAQGYGNGKCRAVGKYDTFYMEETVYSGEEVIEEV